jgi:hypothetical protein
MHLLKWPTTLQVKTKSAADDKATHIGRLGVLNQYSVVDSCISFADTNLIPVQKGLVG